MKIQRKKLSILIYSWGILSAICYALHPTLGKLALLDYNPQTVAILKATIAALLIFLFLAGTKKLKTLKVKTKDIPAIIGSGLLYAGMCIGFWAALNIMKITDLFALYWAYPLINLAIDMIQARKAHLKGVICLTIGVLGVYIASGGMLGSLLTLEPALLYVGLASLCTALYFKANESWKIKEYPMLTRIFWHFLIGPATIALLYRNFSLSTLALVAPMGWVTFGLLALIPCLGGYYFAFKSIKKVGSVATGALSFLEPMVGVILAVVLWKESLTLLQVGGWVLIFISLFNIPKMNNKNE